MITQTFYKTFLRGIIAILTFSIVFGANIALAQNTYVPPAGPPESFNAPAPIHEGVEGQGKWWQLNLPDYTFGALYGAFEGIVSKWVSADDGVAATKFCLMDPSDVEGGGSVTGTSFYTALDYFPTDIQGGISQGLLNCIDWESGWGERILTSLGTGEPGNPNKPPAEDGQFPWWNSDLAEFGPEVAWNLSTGVRLLQGNILAFAQAALKIGTASTFEFVSNEGCPNDANGSVVRARQKIHSIPGLQNLYDGNFIVDCSNGLKLKDLIGSEIEETIIKSVPVLSVTDRTSRFTIFGEFDLSQPRPLCYTTLETSILEKGTVVDCAAKSSGVLTFLGPKYEFLGPSPTFGAEPLETSITIPTLDGAIVGNLSLNSYMTYNWEVPFGVETVNIKACSGGGGGGGGAVGRPDLGEKTAGGGGGGGGFGNCGTYNVPVSAGETLLINVPRGGRGGARGEYRTTNGHVPAQNGTDGSPVLIFKNDWSGEQLVNLPGGLGGKAGLRSDQASNTNIGGSGGKGGATGLVDGNVPQDYATHNGQTGNEQYDIFNIQQISTILGYWTDITSSFQKGGNGGYGWNNPWFGSFPSVAPPYTNVDGWDAGSPGDGGNANDGNHANYLKGGNADRGGWAQGGGGGGGASGKDWANTCAYPDDSTANDSNSCGGGVKGSSNQNDWYVLGGNGAVGGPGFVILTW